MDHQGLPDPEVLAKELARLDDEQSSIIEEVERLTPRLRAAGIKLAINGVVGLAGLFAAAVSLDVGSLLTLISVGMMVWDAFEYAGDVSKWHDLNARSRHLDREIDGILLMLRQIATELQEGPTGSPPS